MVEKRGALAAAVAKAVCQPLEFLKKRAGCFEGSAVREKIGEPPMQDAIVVPLILCYNVGTKSCCAMNGGVDISWWLVALIAFGGIMGLVSFVLKLREWGVYPFQDLTRLFRRPWMEVVLVLSCVCGLVHYGATHWAVCLAKPKMEKQDISTWDEMACLSYPRKAIEMEDGYAN